MNKITTEITEIKTTVSMEQWQQRIMDCQQSGMSIKAWCRENGVATSSYYHYLRKIRESMLQEKQLVPLELPSLHHPQKSASKAEVSQLPFRKP